MNILELNDLPTGDNSKQYRMMSEHGYVDFAILDNELCAHTWFCPSEGRLFLKELELEATKRKLRLTVPTVLSLRLEHILKDNGYTMKKSPYFDDIVELWSKW